MVLNGGMWTGVGTIRRVRWVGLALSLDSSVRRLDGGASAKAVDDAFSFVESEAGIKLCA